MRERKLLLILIITVSITWVNSSGQNSSCQNIGFEFGGFANWKGFTWLDSEMYGEKTEPVEGFVSRRHTIISDYTAYDPNTGGELKLIPPGYSYSARLGDFITQEDRNTLSFRCWNQTLRYTMDIDENNSLLIIKFALVLQYDPGHTEDQEPRFHFTLFDQAGDTIPNCANYEVYASSDNVDGFQFYDVSTGDGDEIVSWRDWSTVGVNLSDYIGQSITVEFLSADCNQGFDYGYAYIVAACHPLAIEMNYCEGDEQATLISPEGFGKYTWTDSNNNVVDTTQVLTIDNPQEDAEYSCEMISESGCVVSLSTKILKYAPHANFGSEMIDCFSNTVRITDSSTWTNGDLFYKWEFENNETSTEQSPEHTFHTSGRHQVKLILSNPPSNCVDTLEKEVESFSPPLVYLEGDSTYCPGESMYLKAMGAYYYTWSNGLEADSIEIMDPGGRYWMLGHSSTGCVSDTHYRTIVEEPEWIFLANGDTTLCVGGDSAIIMVNGAVEYIWNTGDSTNSIMVYAPGIYSCTGKNIRGCPKTNSFNVAEYPIPESDFTLSKHKINSRYNEIAGSILPETDVEYYWDMDDGTNNTGSNISHAYNVNNQITYYTITLTANSIYGCEKTSVDFVDVVPFVPNVFSPNGDGINDIFMPDIELQVFDRTGMILYDGTNGWDGKYNGQDASPDTYFYSIYYNARGDKKLNLKGYLTLVK